MQNDGLPSVWVICAAFNEAATIARVVADLRRGGYDVVVVDDGSTDGTRHVAATVATAVITHPR
jgi:glycosyltransferase involved in cell wall biosynthesis